MRRAPARRDDEPGLRIAKDRIIFFARFGSAGIAVLVDPRWTSVKLMLQVEALMVALMVIAAVRARAEFDTSRPLTWLMLGGFVAVLLGSAYLWYTMEIRPRPVAADGDRGIVAGG